MFRVKIVFLVMEAPYKPWDQLFELCAGRTWVNDCSSNQSIKIIKYFGKPLPNLTRKAILYLQSRRHLRLIWRRRKMEIRRAQIYEDTILVNVYDTWNTMFTKFISALNWILVNEEVDYVIRINSTAYVNINKLYEFLSLGVDYAGPSNGKKFASGWGIILSKYAARELLSYVHNGESLPAANDDRLIGEIMKRKQIQLTLFRAADYEKGFFNEKLGLEDFVMLRVKNNTNNRIRLDSEAFETIYNTQHSG